MRLSRFIPLIAFLTLLLGLWFAPLKDAMADQPVVHAVMFWSDHCGYCHYVIETVLPPLQQKYGDQLQILMLEVSTLDNLDRLFAVAKEYGMSENEVGVPFLIIGDQVLLGSDEIAMQLPILIEQYLGQGGIGYPDSAALRDILPTPSGSVGLVPQQPSQSIAQQTLPSAVQPIYSGFTLATIVMVGMVIALVYAGASFWRAFREDWAPAVKQWMDYAIPVLTLVGMGIAAYLLYVEERQVVAICGPVGDCNAVQNSPYAKLFGILPTSLLGILGYLAILVAWWLRRSTNQPWGIYASLGLFGMSLFGTLFSIYLTYLELFVIRAICIWCLSSAVVMTLLMLVSLPAALHALIAFEQGGALDSRTPSVASED